jgi:hypothetical protein
VHPTEPLVARAHRPSSTQLAHREGIYSAHT